MFFRIENVGPLRAAEVDLSKQLLVLTGPNNTGKTYLAWSVYGLYASRPRDAPAFLDQYVEQLVTSARHEIDLAELLGQHQQELLSFFAADYAKNLHRCFAAEQSRFKGASVALRWTDSREAIPRIKANREMTTFRGFEQNLVFGFLDQEQGSGQLTLTTPIPAAMEPTDQALRRSALRRQILNLVRWAVFQRCEIFPAERIAVNIFAKELAAKRSELVDELVDADLEGQQTLSIDVIRRSTGRYPWPIRDSLRIANDLSRMSREESPFADIAAELESAVMGGKIGITSDGEVSYAPHDAPERNLGVHLTASVVKSLSSLVFYFRHLARPNDFLIIDEPELNLHPDSQRKLARILAKAVKRGFKLMMSTHSDYIIRELNHMIMLSKLSPEAARELGYDPECALAPDSVGVYLFNDHTATSVPVTETGFSIQTIDDQINALNADAQKLYARLFEEDAAAQ
jgi:hypothetical protein